MKTKNIVCGILVLTAALALPVQAQSFLTKGQVVHHGRDAGSGNPSRQWQKNVDPEGRQDWDWPRQGAGGAKRRAEGWGAE